MPISELMAVNVNVNFSLGGCPMALIVDLEK